MESDKYFINPYTFVSVNNNIKRKEYALIENDSISGYFEYEIELKSPLIIPNTSNNQFRNEEKYSNSYGINSYENLNNKNKQNNSYVPIISGSEIRGCIRSIYEALTNSCYNLNVENDIFLDQKALSKDLLNPCVFIYNGKDGWDVYSASNYTYENSNQIQNNIVENNEECYININNKKYFIFDEIGINLVDDCKFNSINPNSKIKGLLVIENRKKRKNIAIPMILAATIAAVSVPCSSQIVMASDTYQVGVSKGYLALRSAMAYDSSNEIGELYSGDTVEVTEYTTSDYWYVYSPKLNRSGYVNNDYLYFLSSQPTSSSGSYTVSVAKGYLALRKATAYDSSKDNGQVY